MRALLVPLSARFCGGQVDAVRAWPRRSGPPCAASSSPHARRRAARGGAWGRIRNGRRALVARPLFCALSCAKTSRREDRRETAAVTLTNGRRLARCTRSAGAVANNRCPAPCEQTCAARCSSAVLTASVAGRSTFRASLVCLALFYLGRAGRRHDTSSTFMSARTESDAEDADAL